MERFLRWFVPVFTGCFNKCVRVFHSNMFSHYVLPDRWVQQSSSASVWHSWLIWLVVFHNPLHRTDDCTPGVVPCCAKSVKLSQLTAQHDSDINVLIFSQKVNRLRNVRNVSVWGGKQLLFRNQHLVAISSTALTDWAHWLTLEPNISPAAETFNTNINIFWLYCPIRGKMKCDVYSICQHSTHSEVKRQITS